MRCDEPLSSWTECRGLCRWLQGRGTEVLRALRNRSVVVSARTERISDLLARLASPRSLHPLEPRRVGRPETACQVMGVGARRHCPQEKAPHHKNSSDGWRRLQGQQSRVDCIREQAAQRRNGSSAAWWRAPHSRAARRGDPATLASRYTCQPASVTRPPRPGSCCGRRRQRPCRCGRLQPPGCVGRRSCSTHAAPGARPQVGKPAHGARHASCS